MQHVQLDPLLWLLTAACPCAVCPFVLRDSECPHHLLSCFPTHTYALAWHRPWFLHAPHRPGLAAAQRLSPHTGMRLQSPRSLHSGRHGGCTLLSL